MGVGGGGACMHFLDRFFGGSDLPRFGRGGVGGRGWCLSFGVCVFYIKLPHDESKSDI